MNQESYQTETALLIPKRGVDLNGLLFSTMFFLPIINGFINEIFLVLGIPSISTFAYYLIYLISFFIYYVALFKNYRKTAGAFLLSVFFIVAEILLHPDVFENLFNFSDGLTGVALSNFFLLFFLGLPLLWISFCLKNESLTKVKYYCERFSYLVLVLFFVTMVLQFGSSTPFNYMTIAYNAMPSLLMMLYCGFEERKTIAKVLFAFGVVLIFVGGCRGALVQLIFATLFFFFFSGNSLLRPKKLLIFLLGLPLILTFILRFNQLMTGLGRLLQSLGFSSRTVNMYLGTSREGSFFHFDDRASIYEAIIPSLSVFGKGIFVYPEGIGYPHNIVIEFLLNYGFILGSILFLGLCVILFKCYVCIRRSNNRFEMILWISAFSTFFVKLMLSASYLTDRAFWFYFSFMLFIIRIERVQVND